MFSDQGLNLWLPAMEASSPNHWRTKESPRWRNLELIRVLCWSVVERGSLAWHHPLSSPQGPGTLEKRGFLATLQGRSMQEDYSGTESEVGLWGQDLWSLRCFRQSTVWRVREWAQVAISLWPSRHLIPWKGTWLEVKSQEGIGFLIPMGLSRILTWILLLSSCLLILLFSC